MLAELLCVLLLSSGRRLHRRAQHCADPRARGHQGVLRRRHVQGSPAPHEHLLVRRGGGGESEGCGMSRHMPLACSSPPTPPRLRSGAINPATVTEHIAQGSADAAAGGASAAPAAAASAHQIVDFTGIARSAADSTDFVVHAMPVSLQSLVRSHGLPRIGALLDQQSHTTCLAAPLTLQILNFDTLTPDQESQFLTTLARDVGLGVAANERSLSAESVLTDLVRVCQVRWIMGGQGLLRFCDKISPLPAVGVRAQQEPVARARVHPRHGPRAAPLQGAHAAQDA